MKKGTQEKVREMPVKKEQKLKKISTIIVVIIFVLGLLITTDILLVTKAHIGPFLAIPTTTYKDGGTKVYYGLGYKVIKYHQQVGRRDTAIGTWSLKYSIEPTTISSSDLAIQLRNYPKKTYQKLYGQFLRVTGTIHKVDNKSKVVTLRYTDPDGAYTMDIDCPMAESKTDLSGYQNNQEAIIIGTFHHYQPKTNKQPAKVFIKNCFIG